MYTLLSLLCRPMVSFLASILSQGSLPESLHPLWTTPLHHDPPSNYPLRAQLLHFLLPTATGVGVALREGPGAGRELIGGPGRAGDGNGFPAASERSSRCLSCLFQINYVHILHMHNTKYAVCLQTYLEMHYAISH